MISNIILNIIAIKQYANKLTVFKYKCDSYSFVPRPNVGRVIISEANTLFQVIPIDCDIEVSI